MPIFRSALFRIAAAFCVAPAALLAHPGHEPGFAGGFYHPIGGLDHLAAMIAIGLWGAQSGRAVLYPAVFIGSLGGGAWLAVSGFVPPLLEPGIVASVLVLGLFVASATRIQPQLGIFLVSLFGVYHGAAHGYEAPAGDGFYAAGFVSAAVCLIGASAATARIHRGLVRAAGWCIVAAGLYFAV